MSVCHHPSCAIVFVCLRSTCAITNFIVASCCVLVRLSVGMFDDSVAIDFSGLCYNFIVGIRFVRCRWLWLFHCWHSVCTMPTVVVPVMIPSAVLLSVIILVAGCGPLSLGTSRIIVYNYWNIYIPFNHDDKLIS